MGSWNGRLRAVLHVVAIAIIGIKTVSAGWAQSEVKEAAEYGIKKMNELVEIYEPQLYKKGNSNAFPPAATEADHWVTWAYSGIWIQRGDPAHYVAAFNSQSEEAKRLATFGYASLQASSRLVSNFPGGRSAIHKFPTVSLLNTPLYDQCPLRDSPRCPHYNDRYRTYDGRCNNPAHPWWGATLMPLHRFLPPNYRDGLERIRESVSGGSLPSARAVSYSIHGDRDSDLSTITHMVMQWGQFLDHDLTASAQTRGFNGSVPRCCWDGGKDFLPQDLTHPDCMPIAVPPDDPFYDHYGVRCLEFVRSSPTSRVGCSLGPRDQINQVTSFIDGSVIYGSSDREAEHLRLFRNGLLKYSRVQYRLPLLPGADHVADLCRGSSGHLKCFHAGDKRVNEQPALIAMHTLWLRVHNRVATELSHLNPHWKDEKIYQEARRIVAALLQHITYKEFLPLILGPDVVQMFDLDLMRKGYYNGYDIQINPTAANAFGSAAFRFGHSLVQRSLVRCDRSHNQLYSNVSLHEELTNPSNMYNIGSVDRLLLGLCMQPSQKRDEFITRELTNHLFQTQRFHYGMDLAALNIQRGRDHGIAPYNAWRGPCGLRPLNDWQDLLKVMSPDTQRRLKRVYRDVDDIDLFTGGMVERPVVGGLVGPTFACIIAQQFSNLRKGDRFWYENGGFESSFTPAQLQQIRRVTLARIMCDNLDTIDTIQPFVFLTPDEYRNERVRCDSNRILSFDLRPWTERLEQNNNYPPPDRYPEHGRPESPQKPDNENSPNYPVDHDHHYHPDVTPTYLIDDKFQSTRPPKPDDDIRPSYLIDDKYQQTRPPSHSYTTTKRPHYGGSDYNKPSYNQHHKEEEFKEKPRPIKPVYPAPDIEVITNFPSIPVSQGSPSKPHKDKYSESSHHYNKPHQENSYENKPSNQNHKPHDNSHHHTSDYIVPHKEDSYQKPSNANHKPNDHYRPPSDYNVPHTEDTYLKPPHDHHHSTSEYGIPHEEDSYIKPPQNNHKPHDDHHSTSNYDIPHQEDTYLKPPSNHHKPHNHYHPTSEYNVPHNEDSYLKPPQDHHQKPHDHHHPTSDYNIPLEEDSYTKPSQSHDHGHDDSYVKPQKPHHHNEFDTDNNVDSYIPQHEHHHKPQDHYTKPQKPQQEVKPYPSYYEEYTLTDSVRPTKKPPQHHGNSKPNKFSEHFNEPSYYYFTSNEDSHNLLKIGSLLIPENETLQDLQNLKNMVKLPVKMGNMTFSVGVKTSLHLGSANSTKGTGLWSFDISDVDEVELPEVPTLPVDPQAIQELPHPIAVLQEEQDTGSRGLD